ncbi:hypothetical protein [Nonomuraea pusilla]|uniref:Uncharacterized protein n=1 Tax=Nonomuraea pusilla TaxID=46177 RepID=A0A1H7PAZ0_9ACTN|nr:hypothetical protein [Nonomuraea pusilla]SEL32257.1 hypothetical protein SAMN05660976_02308 [Nonomuraea pusilla]
MDSDELKVPSRRAEDARTPSSRRPARDGRANDDHPHGTASGPAHAGPVALFDQDPGHVRTRWREVQSSFVDDPGDAVRRADGLVGEVVDAITKALASRRSALRERWEGAGGARDTEQLRLALREYRTVLERLLDLSGGAHHSPESAAARESGAAWESGTVGGAARESAASREAARGPGSAVAHGTGPARPVQGDVPRQREDGRTVDGSRGPSGQELRATPERAAPERATSERAVPEPAVPERTVPGRGVHERGGRDRADGDGADGAHRPGAGREVR